MIGGSGCVYTSEDVVVAELDVMHGEGSLFAIDQTLSSLIVCQMREVAVERFNKAQVEIAEAVKEGNYVKAHSLCCEALGAFRAFKEIYRTELIDAHYRVFEGYHRYIDFVETVLNRCRLGLALRHERACRNSFRNLFHLGEW